jgi:SAM-dependent methyltransferase
MYSRVTETSDWKRVFDGVYETATQLYLILHERMRERGLFDALGEEWMGVSKLRAELGFAPEVAHRFGLALEALRNLGSLELRGDQVRVRTPAAPEVEPDSELIGWAFGPLLDAYLQLYRSDAIFEPSFALAFDEGMDEIWDGLLNAPINLLPRDLAVDWIATPGARVLDLGFGTPSTLRQLAGEVGDDGAVCGLDVSSHFVARARSELADIGSIEQIVCADINDGLGRFDDDSFDGVMFMGALHFVHDPDALFRELARVLRPRTRLAVGMFFIDKPCYSGPALQLHRSFFDPPGTLRSEGEIVDGLWRAGFELDHSIHLGSYCSLYLEQCALVQDLAPGAAAATEGRFARPGRPVAASESRPSGEPPAESPPKPGAFAYEHAHRPLPLRLGNAVGRALGPLGRRLIPLSADSVLRAAERKTKLSARDDPVREPVGRLLESIDADAQLNAVGRWAVRDDTIDLLSKRLRVRDHLARNPQILDTPVDRPVFIIGFPRTGSTFLHNLMALDPGNRVPRLYELLDPLPPEPSSNGAEDPRVEGARKYTKLIDYLSPLALKIHPMGAEDPDECRLLLESGFIGPQYLLYYRIPRYFDWFAGLSDERLEGACRDLRSQIQILKHGDGGRRWVGKNPSHSFFGRGLVRAFPDARIVHLHRDPAETVPSICSMAAAYRSIFSDRIDPRTLGEEGLRMFQFAMRRMTEMRSSPPPASFCDIDYRDLVSDPLEVVRRVYEHAEMELDDDVARRMEDYVARNPQHKHGVHRYSAEQYGLSAADVRASSEQYATWIDRFAFG